MNVCCQVTGRQADVVLAAHYASEVALDLFRKDTENYDVTNAINKVTDLYDVKPCEGMISFNLLQVFDWIFDPCVFMTLPRPSESKVSD